MSVARLVAAPVLLLCLVLAGCSSNDSVIGAADLTRDVVREFRESRKDVRMPDLSAVSAEALRKTDEPLMQIMFPSVKAASVLRVIETNGDHRTWAAWGIVDRRTVSLQRGIVTATRALPHDLMSADVDGVLRRVTRREEGTVPYTQRYADGDHGIVEAKSTCIVSRGYDQVAKIGEINAPVLQMFSSCVSVDRQFVDLYLVDDRGQILQSRQWIGPGLGFMVMRRLR